MEQFEEVFQGNNIQTRKTNLTQNIVVPVVTYNVSGVGSNGTIDKLVVVGVGLNQSEMVVGRNKFDVIALGNGIKNKISNIFASQTLKYLGIFLQNLIGYAQRAFARKHGFPNFAVRTPFRNTLNEAIGIKNYTHDYLSACRDATLLLTQPSMKVHLVDFIKALLVKNALVPKFVKMFVHFFCIVIANDGLQFEELRLARIALEHPNQMHLYGIKNRSFHNFAKFVCCKSKYIL